MVNENLRRRMNEYIERTGISKAELAAKTGISRPTWSQYLNGNSEKMSEATIADIERHICDITGAEEESSIMKNAKKQQFLRTADAVGVLAVCQSCQEYEGLGVVVGRSGFGKTYTLRYYAKNARVAFVECNESMNCRDLVKAIERALSLPHASGTVDDRLDNIKDFFNTNFGWLLVIDEADKLMTRFSQKKAEILRSIYDQSDVGMVLSGEPSLERVIRQYIPRMANRIDFSHTMRGLDEGEVREYITELEADDAAVSEFIRRATNDKNGCFRLLDRTYKNVIRVIDAQNGTGGVTLRTVREASAMMML